MTELNFSDFYRFMDGNDEHTRRFLLMGSLGRVEMKFRGSHS